LTLHATNPSIASRLNMSIDSLIAAMQTGGQPVTAVKVKVRAIQNAATGKPEATHSRHLGNQGRTALDALQQKVDAASPLGAALKKMLRDSG
ncbi:MAG TPA: hypothetical protein VFW00_03280, partial [Rhodocyclaceae bacterium]|nr:hypothetical protein [Rhodocyclaceae bacterium]